MPTPILDVYNQDGSDPEGVFHVLINTPEGDLGYIGLSKQKIETVDLISEGPIKGLTSGIYIYSGQMGEVG